MAKEPTGKPEYQKKYYVLDPDMAAGFDVGGHAIKKDGDNHVVTMLPSQAEYYLDQGALSEKPGKPAPVHALGHGKADEVLKEFKKSEEGRAHAEKPDWKQAPRQVTGQAEAPPMVQAGPKRGEDTKK